MCDYSLLTKVFSRAVFSELLEYSCSSTLNEVIQTFIDNPYENTYGQNIDILYKILKKDFKSGCNNPVTCKNCDFRHYCGNK